MKVLFSNGKTNITVRTVGEAVKELSLLDPSIPMDQDYDNGGSDLTVMNTGDHGEIHVYVAEGGFWD